MGPDRDGAPVWSVVGPMLAHFAMLSLMAVGGGVIMLAPEMQRYVVDSHGWMTAEQFSAAYAIAQAAPGPNMLFVTLVGWQVAGWLGALAATAAIVAPPTLLTLSLMRISANRQVGPFGRAVGKGLVPLSVGFLLATGWILIRGANGGWRGTALSALVVPLVLRTRVNPVWWLAAGAAAGVAGLI